MYDVNPANEAAGSTCLWPTPVKVTGGTTIQVAGSASAADCRVIAPEWDISTISVFSTITDVSTRLDVTGLGNGGRNCDLTLLTYQPSLTGVSTLLDDILGTISNTNYITDNSFCTSIANDYVFDLGSNADTAVQNNLNTGWFSYGIHYNNMARTATSKSTVFGVAVGTYELQITYTTGSPTPITGCDEAIDDLHYNTITNTTAGIAWTTPEANGNIITGYQINYTTPWGDPQTVIVNDTGTTTTSYTVSGLTYNTNYSFRVEPWTTAACHDEDGNILNINTNPFVTIGSLPEDFTNTTNTALINCRWVRTDINDTSLRLNVTYPNTYDPLINFHYKYAMTNDTYDNFTSTIVDANRNMSSFQFNGVDNEIIDVLFTDENTNQTCKYIITQTDFKFLDMLNGYRTGEFGTHGQIGSIDIVFLIIIIISMIGLNRINESVAAFFCLSLIGAAAWFQIVEWPSIVISAIIIIAIIVHSSTRKD